MANQQLIDWIVEYNKTGYTYQQLHDYLLEQGYLELEINESIKYAFMLNQQQNKNQQQNQIINNQEEQQIKQYQTTTINQSQQNTIPIANNELNYNNYLQKNYKQTKPKRNKIIIISIMAIILILIISYFVLNSLSKPQPILNYNYALESQNQIEEITEEINIQNNEEQNNQYNTNAQENSPINQNLTNQLQIPINCMDETCISDKFSTCQRAIYSKNILPELVYEYEIISPIDNYCILKSKYTIHPDPAWQGKEMTCEYNNLLPFNQAVKDTTRCTGELTELFNSGEELNI